MSLDMLIDLTVPAPRRHHQKYLDPRLPHQLQIKWAPGYKTTIAFCNCGVVLGEEKPTAEPIERYKAAYDEHVRWVR